MNLLRRILRGRRERMLLDRVRELEAQNERLILHIREIRGIARPWIPTNAAADDLDRIARVATRALTQEAQP